MSEYKTNFVNRACVFINSGNDHMIQNQVIDDPQQLIKIPFPPEINSQDLVILHPDGHVSKTPNAFMIYRKLFVETARKGGYNLPMNVISSMTSRSWEQEPEEVKNEYRRIAKEAFNYRNELFPKIKPQSKKDQWKIISFDKPSRKIKNPKPMRSSNKPTKRKHQFKSTSKIQVISDKSPELFDNLSDIDMNSPIFDPDLFTDWAEFFNNLSTYQSLDLSITSSNNSSNDFDLPIQADQQINDDIVNSLLSISENQPPIYDTQYGLGIFDHSNTNQISEINPHNIDGIHEIFDIQNTCILDNLVNSNYQFSFSPNLLNTTINQDYLNDALIAFEMGFNYPI
ncbi:12704_t:CDS:1 [Dentiscutata erythropus]|uniref:12704_t:CDS:1 n=1 Tax=Dentiscutata erythropus TaxID=1348616 RepID=A0A9N8WKE1_9GLOM|nr:12704_t:CDS:1 [Dentiscutata erythropus]